MNTLELFDINVEELVDDLRFHWQERDNSYNDTAFSRKKKTSENIMFCCPFHAESNASAGLRLTYPYVFNCFGCGTSANLYKLVAHALGAKNELIGEQYLTKNYFILDTQQRKPIDIESLLDGSELDRKRSVHEGDVQKYLKLRHTYMYRRGFSDHTLDKYEVGFDQESQSIVFPIRTSKGNIRFLKRRSVVSKSFMNESSIDKKDILYGLYYILQAPRFITEVDVNESETDTMACYESKRPAVALLGRLMFKEQVLELAKAGITSVNLFLDNDKAGVEGTIKAYQLISAMTAIRVNVVLFPQGHFGIDGTHDMPYKDANDLLQADKMGDITVIPFEDFICRIKHKEQIEVNWNQFLK